MSSHDPVLPLNLEQTVNAVVNNAFVLWSVIWFDGVETNDSSLSQSNYDFAVFPCFIEQKASRNACEADLLEGLNNEEIYHSFHEVSKVHVLTLLTDCQIRFVQDFADSKSYPLLVFT